MTQIKLRRDTSANFASKNPILGNGEPAYETDTKKLKIGDGTTAYTQLEYFSAGGGGSADIGAVLPLKIVNGVISLEVDGQTIQVVDGKLAASTNMVTTNTTQTITGNKTFRYIGIDDAYGGKTRLGDGQSKIEMAYDGQISLDSATILADQSQNWRVGRYNKAGLIYSASPLKRVGDGPTFTNYDILDSSNLGSHVDGTTITYADGKLTATYSGLELCDIGMALYIDETKGLRRYLNGQIVDINTNTQAFLNRLKKITTLHPSLLCTEEEWQSAKTMSAFGQVGKFVFNYSGDEIVSVRIPRVVNVQGLFDLQDLGMTVEAGLPEHRHIMFQKGGNNVDITETSFVACSRDTGGNAGYMMGQNTTGEEPSLGKSGLVIESNIYGNSGTVQPEAIQYPYFIQIATGSETEANIINTLENVNGFTLLESKYSDKPLYNECWLLSNGQQNAKAVYPTVYEALQVEYNSQIEVGTTVILPSGVSYTKRGLSVKLSTETYTDYDFVLNTAEETFRLPLKNGDESLPDNSSDKITTQTFNSSHPYKATERVFVTGSALTSGGGGANFSHVLLNGKVIAREEGDFANFQLILNKGDVLTTTGTASDANAQINIAPVVGNGSLYYYVGDIDQNHGIVNMGRIGEQLADKIGRTECKAYITETYVNGTSGYRLYSDKWCEQWGYKTGASNTVTLLKEYKDTNYGVLAYVNIKTTGEAYNFCWSGTKTVSTFTIGGNAGTLNDAWIISTAGTIYWKTEGYIA